MDRDRAAGLSWSEVGEWLGLHPDTARFRYGGQTGGNRVRVGEYSPATATSGTEQVAPPFTASPLRDLAEQTEHKPATATVTLTAEKTPATVTEQATAPGRGPRLVMAGEDIDPDTVRVEKTADYDQTGRWQVLAGSADDPVRVGFVAKSSLHRAWQASTAWLTNIPGQSRTRQDAVIQLLLHVQSRRKSRR